MSRMIKLSVWAEEEFGNPIPGSATLSKYARNAMISPPPIKVGNIWRVERSARFVGYQSRPEIRQSDNERLKRILEDGQTS